MRAVASAPVREALDAIPMLLAMQVVYCVGLPRVGKARAQRRFRLPDPCLAHSAHEPGRHAWSSPRSLSAVLRKNCSLSGTRSYSQPSQSSFKTNQLVTLLTTYYGVRYKVCDLVVPFGMLHSAQRALCSNRGAEGSSLPCRRPACPRVAIQSVTRGFQRFSVKGPAV
jgi:hypothetical protein